MTERSLHWSNAKEEGNISCCAILIDFKNQEIIMVENKALGYRMHLDRGQSLRPFKLAKGPL
jgi:hypothetical protein